jgi:phosphomannomutase
VLDLARETAKRVGADLVLANDPDADRVAVMVPGPAAGRRSPGTSWARFWATRY